MVRHALEREAHRRAASAARRRFASNYPLAGSHIALIMTAQALTQNGQFAREWILENRAGAPAFKAVRRRDRGLQIEKVGKQLRSLMSWIKKPEVPY